MTRKLTPQEQYEKKNTRRVTMKLVYRTDSDILQALEESGNMQGYIKALIRQDIEDEKRILKSL